MRKFLVITTVLAILCGFGGTAFAETQSPGQNKSAAPTTPATTTAPQNKPTTQELPTVPPAESPAQTPSQAPQTSPKGNEKPMDEQKNKRDEISEKLEQLTEAQKEEIYCLKDKIIKINMQIVDKYLKWGVIDKDTAKYIKEKLEATKLQMRQNGKLPVPGMKQK